MTTAATYELVDYDRFRDWLHGDDKPYDPMKHPEILEKAKYGAGWLGLFEEEDAIKPPPQASGSVSQPTFYARWRVEYDGDPELCLDGDDAPLREGRVLVDVRLQPGGKKRRVLVFLQDLRLQFSPLSTPSFAIFPESRTQNLPPQNGWRMFRLGLRFTGAD